LALRVFRRAREISPKSIADELQWEWPPPWAKIDPLLGLSKYSPLSFRVKKKLAMRGMIAEMKRPLDPIIEDSLGWVRVKRDLVLVDEPFQVLFLDTFDEAASHRTWLPADLCRLWSKFGVPFPCLPPSKHKDIDRCWPWIDPRLPGL
jgi:hypothetical protein